MKSIRITGLAAAMILLASSTPSLCIEGLHITVQCPDVILSWPSTSGETYIVQWRPSLDPGTNWLTLTNSLPAATGTNFTLFVHTNQVECSSGQMSANLSIGGSQVFPAALVDAVLAGQPSYPLSPPPMPPVRTNGTWRAWEEVFGPQLPIMMPISDALRQRVLTAGAQGTLLVFDATSGTTFSVNDSGVLTPWDGPQPDGPQPDGPQPVASMGFYQVVRDGVHIVGLTNLTSGPVSNTIAISFEAGNAIGTLQEVYVLVDGVAYRGADAIVGPLFYPGTINVDTCFLENGDHTCQVEAGWLNPDIDDSNNFMFHRASDSFTLTVSNTIYYPEWEEEGGEYGESAYFVKTTCTNADWSIDIYDVNTNFVQRLTGHTDDGIIEAYWNLVDTNGVTRTNTDTDPEFSAIITLADPATKKLPKKKPTVAYPTHGQWVITYQDNFSFCANSNYYYEAIYDFGAIASQFGGAVTYFPSSPTNGQTFPLRYPYTNPVVDVPITTMLLDVHALQSLLRGTNSRNFYYNGHGAVQGIASFLNADMIKSDLRGRYYRFVFLDGCSTAKGKLPSAFGINTTTTQPLSYYQKHRIRPRAFLGYDHDCWFLENGAFVQDGVSYRKRVKEEVWEFLSNFEFFWYYGYFGSDLASALYNAYIYTPSLPYGWQNGDGLRLYGYSGLGIDDYNWY